MSRKLTARPPDSPSHVSAVSELPLERLRCWPENPRTIRPERLEQLKLALTADPEMLQARPLLALPDGTVIAGNQRLRAARELGWQTIPVITVELDRERARLWALRDKQPLRRVGGAGTRRAAGRARRGRRRASPGGLCRARARAAAGRDRARRRSRRGAAAPGGAGVGARSDLPARPAPARLR